MSGAEPVTTLRPISGAGPELRARVLQTLPDRELMLAYVMHDDARAFAELYRRLSPALLAYARRRVRSQHIAEELVQQAFLKAHVARERFALGSPARPWFTRILVNLVRDHLRGVRLRPRSEIDVTELPAAETPPGAEQREISARTQQALSRLRPSQRAVVELHWLEERPFPEVAAALGERLSTVKVRAHRAYRELRRVLA
jgi:RNA polymerase sigma-70 factor (ECF subfamily)